MIATLGMYDLPALRGSVDALWYAIRDRLIAHGQSAPAELCRTRSLWSMWRAPDLLLGQTCGLPYRKELHGHVSLLGAFDYGLPETPAGYYHSVLVARAQGGTALADYADARLAINGFDSESGWAAAQAAAKAAGFSFSEFLHTGAHVDSIRAVQSERADIAAIDAVTWRLISGADPSFKSGLRVVARSTPTPGLPLITTLGQDTALLKTALCEALEIMDDRHCQVLGIKSFVDLASQAYLAVPMPDLPSQAKAVPAPQALQSHPSPA